MNRPCGPLAVVLLVAAVFLPLTARGEHSSAKPSLATTTASARLLSRDTVVPVSMVARYFPDLTEEVDTAPNETSVGKVIASISVVFTSPDRRKKITLSVDEYENAGDAAAAYATAVEGSKVAPGFKSASAPDLGQEAFAGVSQVGAEMHFGLGARDGRLIVSATHAGDIPVTRDNSTKLITLASEVLAAARRVRGP